MPFSRTSSPYRPNYFLKSPLSSLPAPLKKVKRPVRKVGEKTVTARLIQESREELLHRGGIVRQGVGAYRPRMDDKTRLLIEGSKRVGNDRSLQGVRPVNEEMIVRPYPVGVTGDFLKVLRI